jgi:hypothetical protein
MGNKLEKGDNNYKDKNNNNTIHQKNNRILSNNSEGELRQKERLYSEKKILENFESK